MSSSSDTKRILKNTLMLYFRMGFVMLVNLYLVRLVLMQIGVEDYGIYSVVSGLVVLCSFLSNSMAAATQRHFSFAIGCKDNKLLKATYNTNLIIYLVVAGVSLVLLETVGLWFVNNVMKVPSGRLHDVLWLYQFSVASFVALVFYAPLSSILFAHEDMGWYAGTTSIEVLLKLIGVLLLPYFSGSRLIGYGIVLCGASWIVSLMSFILCRTKYSECQLSFKYIDAGIFREIITFTAWTLFGTMAQVFRTQGVTLLLNQYFTPAVVAAQAIAFKVSNVLTVFSSNFNAGIYPPIVKFYAEGEREKMFKLLFLGSKLTFFLLWLVVLPVGFRAHILLLSWLGKVPEGAVTFAQLILAEMVVHSITQPLCTAARAYGKLMLYELPMGVLQFSILIVSWICLRQGCSPSSVFIVAVLVNVIMGLVRVLVVDHMVHFSLANYIRHVVLRTFAVLLLSFVLGYGFNQLIPNDFWGTILIGGFTMFMTMTVFYFVGLSAVEKVQVRKFLVARMKGKIKS